MKEQQTANVAVWRGLIKLKGGSHDGEEVKDKDLLEIVCKLNRLLEVYVDGKYIGWKDIQYAQKST